MRLFERGALKDLRVFDNFITIPYGIRLVIYGANNVGINLYHTLKQFRGDISIVCFVDSFREFDLDGVPVVRIDHFARIAPEYDYIAITHLNRLPEIELNLAAFPLEKLALCFASSFNFYGSRGPVKLDDWHRRAARIHTALSRPEDKRLWGILTTGMMTGSLRGLADYLESMPVEPLTYLEHGAPGKGGVVIEGGAFDGETTLRFADAVGPDGVVYAFEPLGPDALAVHIGTRIDLAPRIRILKQALWSEPAELGFIAEASASRVIVGEPAGAQAAETQTVQAISVDIFAQERGLSRLDLIKLDIEGAELAVLRGAETSIKRFRPIISTAIYHGPEQYVSVPNFLIDMLEGYQFFLTAHSAVGTDVILHCVPSEAA
ncbi:MAG TPA: FkbM family methyltransferase [Aliidongia sp.]|nr:FkbM family methyltransferase [Aliidongia sp.]